MVRQNMMYDHSSEYEQEVLCVYLRVCVPGDGCVYAYMYECMSPVCVRVCLMSVCVYMDLSNIFGYCNNVSLYDLVYENDILRIYEDISTFMAIFMLFTFGKGWNYKLLPSSESLAKT